MLNALLAALFILGLPLILIVLGLLERPNGIVWIYRIIRDEQGRPRALLIAGILVVLMAIMAWIVFR